MTEKLESLADAYGVLEYKVGQKYVLVPEGEEEASQPLGVVVDSE